jgi:hypothetical protein
LRFAVLRAEQVIVSRNCHRVRAREEADVGNVVGRVIPAEPKAATARFASCPERLSEEFIRGTASPYLSAFQEMSKGRERAHFDRKQLVTASIGMDRIAPVAPANVVLGTSIAGVKGQEGAVLRSSPHPKPED